MGVILSLYRQKPFTDCWLNETSGEGTSTTHPAWLISPIHKILKLTDQKKRKVYANSLKAFRMDLNLEITLEPGGIRSGRNFSLSAIRIYRQCLNVTKCNFPPAFQRDIKNIHFCKACNVIFEFFIRYKCRNQGFYFFFFFLLWLPLGLQVQWRAQKQDDFCLQLLLKTNHCKEHHL